MRQAISDEPVIESATELLLLQTMADYMSVDGRRMFPSVATLAERTRLGKATVSKWLTVLRAKGLLVLVSPAKKDGTPAGGRESAEYEFGARLRRRLEVANAEPANARPALYAVEASPLPTGGQPSTNWRRSEDLKRDLEKRRGSEDFPPPAAMTGGEEHLAAYAELWTTKYGRPYIARPKDLEHAALLETYGRDPDRLRKAMRAMLEDEKSFYYKTRHPFWAFVQDVDAYYVPMDSADVAELNYQKQMAAVRPRLATAS
jgi:hypothetical protein